jgi:hypothetical protein
VQAFADVDRFCQSIEARIAKQKYRAAHDVADIVGLPPLVLSRLLSVVTVKDIRGDGEDDVMYSIGLALKFARRELQVSTIPTAACFSLFSLRRQRPRHRTHTDTRTRANTHT